MPLILGGIVAAILGFMAAWFGFGQTDNAPDAALIARIGALETQIEALPVAPDATDLQPLTDAQAALDTSLSELDTGTTARFDAADLIVADLNSRLNAVERAPSDDGAVTDTAIASIERELDGLRAEVTAQQARVQGLVDTATAALAAAEAQSAQRQADAEATAQSAVARAALARLQLALDGGTPFDQPLADLAEAGVVVPDALAAVAETGVATLATLQADFPDAARTALTSARTAEDAGGIGGFLSSQFQVRSVEPRDGSDADAVLSRAEASVREGRLADAMAEIDALPEGAADALAAWRAQAGTRMDAVSAANTLDQSLTQ